MIPFDEALQIMLDASAIKTTETIDLQETLGRILAQDIFADADSPAFDKSAMDGYAIRLNDLGKELQVIETIAAGEVPKKEVGTGQCSKIMTGAMLPKGADAVLMVEDTELTTEGKMVYTKPVRPNVCDADSRFNPNIRFQGEDCKQGDLILKKGLPIKAQHIAMMAGVGVTEPLVYEKMKVGVITTGDEVVEPDETPTQGQIRNTNGSQLVAQLQTVGADCKYYGIAPDTKEATLALVKKAKSENDMIILTGGVSMGDFDFVPWVLKEAGFEILFQKVAVQPGKPTLFGRSEGAFCLGLPGNPVSAFMQFELMAKPFLLQCMGKAMHHTDLKLSLGETFSRKKDKRKAWIPVSVRDNQVYRADYNGSGHMNALGAASAIIAFPVGVKVMEQGQEVGVKWI